MWKNIQQPQMNYLDLKKKDKLQVRQKMTVAEAINQESKPH